MCKKIFCTIIILIMLVVFSIPVLANPVNGEPDIGSSTLQNPLKAQDNTEKADEKKEAEKSPFEKLLTEIVNDKNTQETEQFLATITSNDTLFKKLYLICGYSAEENIGVILARYNEDKGIYEEFVGTTGESRWDIGDSGFFTKEFELEKGENKLKLIVYKKPSPESLKNVENINSLAYNIENIENIENTLPGNKAPKAIENKEAVLAGGQASKDTVKENLKIKLEPGKNLQINYFTVKVLDESVKDKLVNSVTKLTDILKNDIINKIIQPK